MEENKIVYTEPEIPEKEKILIVGWNDRAKYIINELDLYVPVGSEVHVVSKFDDATKAIRRLENEIQNITVDFEVMDTTDRSTLESPGSV